MEVPYTKILIFFMKNFRFFYKNHFNQAITLNFLALPFEEKLLSFLRGYLGKIVNHPNGIIFKSRIIRKPFQMERKTGTSQALRIIQEQRAQVMTKTNSNCYGNTESIGFLFFAIKVS